MADKCHRMETFDQPPAGRYITFQVSGRYFAMFAERVREMMPMQPLAPFAADAAGVLGAVQTRGRMIPIFDLRAELGLKARASSRQESLIIVTAHDGYEFGFAVDKITGMIDVHPDDIRNAAIQGHGRIRTILHPHALVNQDRLFAAVFASISFSS